MLPISITDQETDGLFVPHLGLMLAKPEGVDADRSTLLHEIAHALTFAGSEFYSGQAAHYL